MTSSCSQAIPPSSDPLTAGRGSWRFSVDREGSTFRPPCQLGCQTPPHRKARSFHPIRFLPIGTLSGGCSVLMPPYLIPRPTRKIGTLLVVGAGEYQSRTCFVPSRSRVLAYFSLPSHCCHALPPFVSFSSYCQRLGFCKHRRLCQLRCRSRSGVLL